jgi:cell division protein ZapE
MSFSEHYSNDLEREQSEKKLLSSYQASLDIGELDPDPHQKIVILALQKIFDNLLASGASSPLSSSSQTSFKDFFFKKVAKPIPPIVNKGLYVWGDVGRGKTHLVDLFYKMVPIKRKMRLHFHRFMHLVHEDLDKLDSVVDPLKVIAKNFSEKARLLVLDEIHVTDITDAMLLGKLFEHLFGYGVMLVTTSNTPPDELYKNGLQRDRFKPAITLLKKHTKVIEMGGKLDYRLQRLSQGDLYSVIDEPLSKVFLLERFNEISAIRLHQDRQDIIINGRRIPVEKWADGVVWFSFKQLCNTPRSTSDYSQIAKIYHTILISNIPIMDNDMNDAARRFTNMIDIFYDFHVNLIVTAQAQPEKLYISSQLKEEFKRTTSRLKEMQSKEYLQAQHLP